MYDVSKIKWLCALENKGFKTRLCPCILCPFALGPQLYWAPVFTLELHKTGLRSDLTDWTLDRSDLGLRTGDSEGPEHSSC